MPSDFLYVTTPDARKKFLVEPGKAAERKAEFQAKGSDLIPLRRFMVGGKPVDVSYEKSASFMEEQRGKGETVVEQFPLGLDAKGKGVEWTANEPGMSRTLGELASDAGDSLVEYGKNIGKNTLKVAMIVPEAAVGIGQLTYGLIGADGLREDANAMQRRMQEFKRTKLDTRPKGSGYERLDKVMDVGYEVADGVTNLAGNMLMGAAIGKAAALTKPAMAPGTAPWVVPKAMTTGEMVGGAVKDFVTKPKAYPLIAAGQGAGQTMLAQEDLGAGGVEQTRRGLNDFMSSYVLSGVSAQGGAAGQLTQSSKVASELSKKGMSGAEEFARLILKGKVVNPKAKDVLFSVAKSIGVEAAASGADAWQHAINSGASSEEAAHQLMVGALYGGVGGTVAAGGSVLAAKGELRAARRRYAELLKYNYDRTTMPGTLQVAPGGEGGTGVLLPPTGGAEGGGSEGVLFRPEGGGAQGGGAEGLSLAPSAVDGADAGRVYPSGEALISGDSGANGVPGVPDGTRLGADGAMVYPDGTRILPGGTAARLDNGVVISLLDGEPLTVSPEGAPSAQDAAKTLFSLMRAGDMTVLNVDVDAVAVNDRIVQFKGNADPLTGVVAGEELRGSFQPIPAKPILVMQFNDGHLEVATGRHRLQLAKDNGMSKIPANIIREADGWTAELAQTVDAYDNILDEKGSDADFLKFFAKSGVSREEAEGRGLTSRTRGRNAFDVAQSASPDIQSMVLGGDSLMSLEKAAVIARAAPVRLGKMAESVQRAVSKQVLEGSISADVADLMARSMMEAYASENEANRFAQGDLFGADDTALMAMSEEARYASNQKRELRSVIVRLDSALRRGDALSLKDDYAKGLGIKDLSDKGQIQEALKSAQDRYLRWDRYYTDVELSAEARAYAREMLGMDDPLIDTPEGFRGLAELSSRVDPALRVSEGAAKVVADSEAVPQVHTYMTREGRQLQAYSRRKHAVMEYVNASLVEGSNVEESAIEQRFQEYRGLEVYGSKVRSVNDVAYIANVLKMESVEHSMVVVVDGKGRPFVFHMTIGSNDTAPISRLSFSSIVNSVKDPASVYLVHNHPSGDVMPSQADIECRESLQKSLSNVIKDVPLEAIVIDTYKDKYMHFGADLLAHPRSVRVPERKVGRLPVMDLKRANYLPSIDRAMRLERRCDLVKSIAQAVRDREVNSYGVMYLSASGDVLAHAVALDAAEFKAGDVIRTVARTGSDGVILYDLNEGAGSRFSDQFEVDLREAGVPIFDWVATYGSRRHEGNAADVRRINRNWSTMENGFVPSKEDAFVYRYKDFPACVLDVGNRTLVVEGEIDEGGIERLAAATLAVINPSDRGRGKPFALKLASMRESPAMERFRAQIDAHNLTVGSGAQRSDERAPVERSKESLADRKVLRLNDSGARADRNGDDENSKPTFVGGERVMGGSIYPTGAGEVEVLSPASRAAMPLRLADVVEMYRQLSGRLPKIVNGRSMGRAVGRYVLATDEIRLSAEIFGLLSKDDVRVVRERLYAQGYFRNMNPAWAAEASRQILEREVARSQEALQRDVKKLVNERIKAGVTTGRATKVMAHELWHMVDQMDPERGGISSRGSLLGHIKALKKELEVAFTPDDFARNNVLVEEAKAFIPWWKGYRAEDGLTAHDGRNEEIYAEMGGAFFADPSAVESKAPNFFNAMQEALAEHPRARACYDQTLNAIAGGMQNERLVEQLTSSWSKKNQAAMRKLGQAITKVGGWRNFQYSFIANLWDKRGPAIMMLNESLGATLKQAKKDYKNGILTKEEFEAMVAQSKETLEAAKYNKLLAGRGASNHAKAFLADVQGQFYKALEKVDSRPEVAYEQVELYAYLRRVVELRGRATAYGIDAPFARNHLNSMMERLGFDKAKAVIRAWKVFRSIYEKYTIENPMVREMFGDDFIEMMRKNSHYVSIKHVPTPEEVEKMQRAADSGDQGAALDLAMLKIRKLLPWMQRDAGAVQFMHPLKGSIDPTTPPLYQTMKTAIGIDAAALENNFILMTAKVLTDPNFPHPEARVVDGSKAINNARYASVFFLENGEKKALVLPRRVADAISYVNDTDRSPFRSICAVTRILSSSMTTNNPLFVNNAQIKDIGSAVWNVKGLHRSWFHNIPVTGVAMDTLGTFASQFLSPNLVRAIHDKVPLGMGKLLVQKNTINYWMSYGRKIAKIIQSADFEAPLMRANQLRAEGKKEAADMEEYSVYVARAALNDGVLLNLLQVRKDDFKESDLDRLFERYNLKKRDSDARNYVNFARRLLGVLKPSNLWNEVGDIGEVRSATVKLAAYCYLYDRKGLEPGNLPEKLSDVVSESERKKIALKTAIEVGDPQFEARGIWMTSFEMMFGPFINARMKGFFRTWNRAAQSKGDMADFSLKASASITRRVLTTLIASGALAKMLETLFTKLTGKEASEENMNGTGVGQLHHMVKWQGKAMRNVRSYYLMDYHVMPIFLSDDGKETIAIRLPKDEETKFIDLLTIATMNHLGVDTAQEQVGLGTVVKELSDTVLPIFNENNLLLNMLDIFAPYISQTNPYSPFLGREIYDENEFRARYMRPDLAFSMGKKIWNNTPLINNFFVFNESPSKEEKAASFLVQFCRNFPILKKHIIIESGGVEQRIDNLKKLDNAKQAAVVLDVRNAIKKIEKGDVTLDQFLEKHSGGDSDLRQIYSAEFVKQYTDTFYEKDENSSLYKKVNSMKDKEIKGKAIEVLKGK